MTEENLNSGSSEPTADEPEVTTGGGGEPEPSGVEPQETPEYAPTWLEDDGADHRPSQPEPSWQPQNQPQHQPQYQNLQQPPQQHLSDEELSRLVQNPQAYIEQILNQRLAQTVGPLAQNYQQLEQSARSYMYAQTMSRIDDAKDSIGKAYKDVLNRDEAFKANPRVKAETERALKNMYNKACTEAQRGNFTMLKSFGDPEIYEATLYLAKKRAGYKPSAKELESLGRQLVEASAPKKESFDASIPPDVRDVLEAQGESAKQRYIENQKKFGDRITWSGQ